MLAESKLPPFPKEIGRCRVMTALPARGRLVWGVSLALSETTRSVTGVLRLIAYTDSSVTFKDIVSHQTLTYDRGPTCSICRGNCYELPSPKAVMFATDPAPLPRHAEVVADCAGGVAAYEPSVVGVREGGGIKGAVFMFFSEDCRPLNEGVDGGLQSAVSRAVLLGTIGWRYLKEERLLTTCRRSGRIKSRRCRDRGARGAASVSFDVDSRG
ncbi:hypothetical protein LSAT2_003736 [Lamellibrachia satsuma]|nr:hypothetical protein LSAT2_003736 [Lamellibrachia satsuma]